MNDNKDEKMEEMTPQDVTNGNSPRKRKSNMIAGLILIGIGVTNLLARYIPQINWRTAWPVILIVVGILLIIPFKNKKS